MINKKTTVAVAWVAALTIPSGTALATGFFGIGPGLSDNSTKGLKDSGGARVYGGMLFSEEYGVEIGYIDFGDFDVENRPSGNFVNVSGGYVAISGANRISPTTELTGKLGAFHYEYEASTGGRVNSSTDGTSAMLGIGANFYLTPAVALGVEFTHLNDVEDEDINSLWLQLHVRLGGD